MSGSSLAGSSPTLRRRTDLVVALELSVLMSYFGLDLLKGIRDRYGKDEGKS